MSPTKPTVSPSTRPLSRRMVKMSRSPCVGCSWAPSPALTTPQWRCWASRCGPRHRMAHHHHVDAHRLDVLGGVDERLALADAGAARREVVGVGAEALGREGEAGPRARGRLEKQVDDHLALEVVAFLLLAAGRLDEALGGVENGFDLRPAEFFQAEQVTASPGHCFRLNTRIEPQRHRDHREMQFFVFLCGLCASVVQFFFLRPNP